MSWLVRNWHLKLGALALATVLYTGLVYSGSFTDRTFPGVPVEAINQPDGAYPLTQQLGVVDVSYRLAADAAERVTVDSFTATVDLSEYDLDLAPERQALPVRVTALGEGIEVLDFTPKTVPVALDRLGEKEVPVVVERGDVPEGLSIGTPRVSDRTVIATGPESQLGRVERAVARVQIFATGIDIARQVDLIPVDVDGRQVEAVELDPTTVTVQIDVRMVETSKTVPVAPAMAGTPAAGFELSSVTVAPPVVTLFGTPDALADVDQVATLPIDVAGIAESATFDAELSLPADVRVAGDSEPIVVSVEVAATTATRTLVLGILCEGAAQGVACLPGQSQVAVTLRGPAAQLAGLDPGDLTPVVDVSGLAPGEHDLTPAVALPDGIELVSISPGVVPVTLRAPATPAPTPG